MFNKSFDTCDRGIPSSDGIPYGHDGVTDFFVYFFFRHTFGDLYIVV